MDAISPVFIVKYSPQYYRAYPNATPSINITENVTATPEPTETIIHVTTPKPTVTVVPTSEVHYVDPYSGGERFEGMWYRWTWHNASGLQDANRGIIIYKHLYLDSFTYWDDAWGNYYTQLPPAGYRYLAVFVHEEDFGPDDDGLWGYQNTSFYLQYGGSLHRADAQFNPVYRIVELEERNGDYYSIDFIKPFGIERVYGGVQDSKTGGYHVNYLYSLRTGKGNSWDGYILYLVPVSVTDDDIRIVGNFANQNVNWRFDVANRQRYPTEGNIQKNNGVIEPVAITTEPTFRGG